MCVENEQCVKGKNKTIPSMHLGSSVLKCDYVYGFVLLSIQVTLITIIVTVYGPIKNYSSKA